ncbi:MAG TPA: tetratricopeptide repeat protein [Verrucomicrobiota bacterium]|nr:tetratricopeptide repeat protein [Verrucomicrobiota bacterium]
MSSDIPADIPPPDNHHLSSATGWLQLGNPTEALADLGKVSPEQREHHEVLHLEWHIHAQNKVWESCLEIGRVMVNLHPHDIAGWINQANALFYLKRAQEAFELLESVRGKHPKNEAIPYNLSCYACQFGDLTLAMDCYQEAAQVGDREKIREVALQDPDMEPIWDQITD